MKFMRHRYFILVLVIPCLLSLFVLPEGYCAEDSEDRSGAAGDDDATNMVEIPKGWFKMGSDTGEINERPEHDVFLDTFLMDKFEVSAKEFAGFLNEKGNPEHKYFSPDMYATIMGVSYQDGKEVEDSTAPQKYAPRPGFENYPANNVSWFGADAYCRWKKKHLPTEAEWEKAARSGDGRTYPWGDTMPDDKKARYNQTWEVKGFNVMVPVDALPESASPYGALNMAGNVWEWVNDWFRQNYCNFCFPVSGGQIDIAARLMGAPKDKIIATGDETEKTQVVPPRYDPKGPSYGVFKILRGGSWYDSFGEAVIRTTYRYWFDPEERYLNTGFRCAK
jgi:formylglycine-generating enzyme required for sulfatase activity